MTREEAIKILKAIRVYECYPKSASEETKEAIDMAIEALQTEVVRCEDCKYLNRKDAYGDEWKECTHYPQHHIRLNDFCSYGERREL